MCFAAVFILSCVISNSSKTSEVKKNVESDTSFKWLKKMMQDSITKYNFPSFAIGVVYDGKIIYTDAVGWADRAKKIPATAESVYQIGSLTKTFTGNVLAHLILNRTINLDADISTYFPATVHFPADSNGKKLTVKDIATHSSGLPRYPGNLDRVDGEPMMGYTKEQMYEALSTMRLERNVGVAYSYSNFGYGVLGTAMENVTKQPYAQLLEKYIFKPLSMNSSSGELDSKVKNKLTTAYYDDRPNEESKPWQMGALVAHGGIFSNVKDISRFMIHFMDTAQADIKLQQTPFFRISRITTYGLGIFMTNYGAPQNTMVMYHGGDLDSYASNMICYPQKKLGMVMMSNGAAGRGLGNLFTAIENELYKRYAK